MKLLNREELLESFLGVATYLFERGEMIKAYQFINTCPSILEEDEQVLELKTNIRKRLEEINKLHLPISYNNYPFPIFKYLPFKTFVNYW